MHSLFQASAGPIITICCWTDIRYVETNFNFAWSSRTQLKSDQASAKLYLTFTKVGLTKFRCQTVIISTKWHKSLSRQISVSDMYINTKQRSLPMPNYIVMLTISHLYNVAKPSAAKNFQLLKVSSDPGEVHVARVVGSRGANRQLRLRMLQCQLLGLHSVYRTDTITYQPRRILETTCTYIFSAIFLNSFSFYVACIHTQGLKTDDYHFLTHCSPPPPPPNKKNPTCAAV